jgi:hypothetical protein
MQWRPLSNRGRGAGRESLPKRGSISARTCVVCATATAGSLGQPRGRGWKGAKAGERGCCAARRLTIKKHLLLRDITMSGVAGRYFAKAGGRCALSAAAPLRRADTFAAMPRFAAAPPCAIEHPMFNLQPLVLADVAHPVVENSLHDALFAPETMNACHQVRFLLCYTLKKILCNA